MPYANISSAIVPTAHYPVISGADAPNFTGDLFSRFIDYTDRKETTVKGYVTCIRQFANWMTGNGITQPQRADIKAYRDHLKASDLATGTQAQYLRAVKHFFKWTAAEGLYPNVADNVHGAKVKNDSHKKDALPRKNAMPIADTIDRNTEQGKRLYAMYLLGIELGLRLIEINRADVCDIKTVGGDPFLYVQPKGHDGKDSPKYLMPHIKEAIDDYLQSRSTPVTPKSPLFTSTSNRSKGQRIATTTISTMIKGLLVKSGFDSDRITPHSTRATAATAGFEAGLSVFEVQHLMGHCDPSTTEIYIKDINILELEKKGRTRIHQYLTGEFCGGIMPELEAAIMALSPDEQKELLQEITAKKGEKTA